MDIFKFYATNSRKRCFCKCLKFNGLQILSGAMIFVFSSKNVNLVNNNKHWLDLNIIVPTPAEWLSKSRHVLGLMSGTSLDGIDLVLAKFMFRSKYKVLFTIVGCEFYNFSTKIVPLLQMAIENNATTSEISYLNFALAYEYSKAVRKFLKKLDFPIDKVDAVGVHGQTVWHDARGEYSNSEIGHTLQLVSLPAMAAELGRIVVGDFRTKDVAKGGEGAPLVPIFDYYFLRSMIRSISALNIGGIANITYLPKKCKLNEVVAFDTGPGNVLINIACKKFFGKEFDNNGEIAKSGKVNNSLLKSLKSIPFIRKKPPKSTGRELFNEKLLNNVLFQKKHLSPEDIVATLAFYTCWSIAENIRNFAAGTEEIVVSGGGAENEYLIEQIQNLLPKVKITKSDSYGIPTKFKEALAFGFLAYLRLGNIPANLPSTTGARERVTLGVVAS